jgi:TDG/mug DNA glycosylase family protein
MRASTRFDYAWDGQMTGAIILARDSAVAPAAVLRSPDKLPDLLRPDLDVVFAGTAASSRAAETGHYYAGPGNRFWRTLHEVGITPREFAPREDARLLDLGIGLTDVSKAGCGMDHQIAHSEFDVSSFEDKMRRLQPRAIAFTSKTAASHWLRCRTGRIGYGRQHARVRFPVVFVLSSPSGAARRYWRIASWHELADWLRATQPWRF